MTDDRLRDNSGLKYDHRNLLIEISRLISENEIELTRYYYDEAGNRIRKLILRHWSGGGGIPDPPDWGDIENLPIYEPEGEGGEGWSIFKNEFYVRGVGGNELAIYNFDQLEQWNVYGTDNVGKITKEEEEEFNFYYLKDHLGSIRAVINEDNEVVNAQDYDMWGYLLENRSYNSIEEKYKFTGKERDDESSYDYFGARYYVSRIGRWGGADPLFDIYPGISPYIYCLLNPLKLADSDGLKPRITINGNNINIQFEFYYVSVEDDPIKGLKEEQIIKAENLIENMDSFSGEFTYKGEKYKMNFTANMYPLEGKYNDVMSDILIEKTFVNFIMNAPEDELKKLEQGVGMGGEVLYLASGDKLQPYKTSGLHELMHYFKLTHEDVRTRIEIINGQKIKINSIMGRVAIFQGIEYRDDPTARDLKLVFKRNIELFK